MKLSPRRILMGAAAPVLSIVVAMVVTSIILLIARDPVGDVWAQLFPAEQQRITRLLIERVQLHGHGLDIVWREDGWIGFGADIGAHPLVEESSEQAEEALA